MTMWESINAVRIKKGLSIQKLADISGVSKNTIVAWIYQRSCPNILLLWQVADALNVSIDELIGRNFSPLDNEE